MCNKRRNLDWYDDDPEERDLYWDDQWDGVYTNILPLDDYDEEQDDESEPPEECKTALLSDLSGRRRGGPTPS